MKRIMMMVAVVLAMGAGDVISGDFYKTNNADSLNLTTSWTNGAVPGVSDIAIWNSIVTAANTPTLDANLHVAGIRILNPGGDVGLTPATINSGTVTANSAVDTFTYSGSAVANGNIVTLKGGTMPTGVTANRHYVVTNATATTYQIADGIGGTIVDFTANGANVTNTVQPALIIGGSGIDMVNATKSFSSLGAVVSLASNQTWAIAATYKLDSNNNVNNAGIPVVNNGNTLTVSNGASSQVDVGVLHGTGGLVKKGAGTLLMAATTPAPFSSFTGNVVVDEGTMQAGNDAGAFGSGSATLTINGGTLTAKGSAAKNYGRNTTVAGNTTFLINNSSGNGGMAYSFGTLSIGAYIFTVTHQAVGGGAMGSLTFGATTLTGDTVFDVSSSNANVLVLGAVGGGFGLTKAGIGILRLVGDNTYSGATTVNNGVLQLTNSATVKLNPATTLNVVTNGTFMDTYTTARSLTNDVIKGAGTLIAGVTNSAFVVTGSLAPGDGGVGTLNVTTGCVQMAAGSTYALEMTGSAASPTNDLVNLSGPNSAVSFGGAWTLNIKSYTVFDPVGMTNILFDYTGADPSLVQPAITFDSGTAWAGGQVSVDAANTRIILTGLRLKRAGSLISVW
jgi:fibronectin-binding autotransporter adhesin